MKLSVVTPTCRANPRFAEMARTLLASFCRAPADTELEWIIVDDRLWREDPDERIAPVREVLAHQPDDVQARVHLEHFAPPPTDYRGPEIADPLPAHNTARNAGLGACALDSRYVVILSDCTVVTAEWVTVALELASKNMGWKCRTFMLHDHPIPHDVPFHYQDAWDNLHAAPSTTVAGPCWGAPRDALLTVGGFDTDYDGEDDYYDHEVLLRLGRSGIQFVTTKRAGCVRLRRTQIKSDVTTRQEVLRAKRNQLYFQHLGQDKLRILPGAAAAAASGGILAQPGRRAAELAPRPVAGRAAPRVAPASPAAAPRPALAYNPPPRPSPALPAAPRDGDDGAAPAGAAAVTVEIAVAQHAHEICGFVAPAGTARGTPCKLVRGHRGAHVHGTPEWVFGIDPAAYVMLYQNAAGELARFEASGEAHDDEGRAHNHRERDRLNDALDDLWYVLSDEQRDEIDPDGAAKRAADRVPPPPPAPPMSLHERAKQAAEQRKVRHELEKAGKAPPPDGDERCVYIPNQGTFKGQQCRLRARHGGAHQYEIKLAPPVVVPADKAKTVTPSREPPKPQPAVAATIAKLDDVAAAIGAQLAKLPNDAARQVVMLGVVVRRDGILVDEQGYLDMLDEAIVLPQKELDQATPIKAKAVEQAIRRVREICATLPAIPCTAQAFEAVGAYAMDLDMWRVLTGLPPRAELTLYNRAYAAAGDAGLEIAMPDDFGDYAADDLAALERLAAEVSDEVDSVEPLSDEEAAHQAMAPVREIAQKYIPRLAESMGVAEDIIRGTAPDELMPFECYPPIVWSSPAEVHLLLGAAPGSVVVEEDDCEALRTCWPPAPEEWPAEQRERWGPTADKTVAIVAYPQ